MGGSPIVHLRRMVRLTVVVTLIWTGVERPEKVGTRTVFVVEVRRTAVTVAARASGPAG